MVDFNIASISTYKKFLPGIKMSAPKTQQEELQEIIQSPNDPLAKFPLRAFGYSNEVGAAVSAMPGWGKIAEAGLWVPALMYLGADIYDKYKRGKEGNYSQESVTKAVEQACFQALASVILPTAAVKMGQGLAGQFSRFDGSNLSASVKEELYDKLANDFAQGKFAKGNRYFENGKLQKARRLIINRINDNSFADHLAATRKKLKEESVFRKIIKFFGHSSGFDSTVKANQRNVKRHLFKSIKDIYNMQILIENGTLQDIQATGDKKLIKLYQKFLGKAAVKFEELIEHRPNFVIEKILSTSNKEYDNPKKIINELYPSIADKKRLVARTDEGMALSSSLINKFRANEMTNKLVEKIAQKSELSNEIIASWIQNKKLKLGLLKTTGGFIALGLLAVPIDNFVHTYIIKKFLEPGLENVKNFNPRVSFKKFDEFLQGRFDNMFIEKFSG